MAFGLLVLLLASSYNPEDPNLTRSDGAFHQGLNDVLDRHRTFGGALIKNEQEIKIPPAKKKSKKKELTNDDQT